MPEERESFQRALVMLVTGSNLLREGFFPNRARGKTTVKSLKTILIRLEKHGIL